MADQQEIFWRPVKYPVDLTIGGAVGDYASGTISLNNSPTLLQFLSHQITGPVGEDGMVVQDGIYRIDWSLYEQVRFHKGVRPFADIGFGSVRHGVWIPFDAPVALPGNQTIHVTVYNELYRGTELPIPWHMQIIFHGLEQTLNVGIPAPQRQ